MGVLVLRYCGQAYLYLEAGENHCTNDHKKKWSQVSGAVFIVLFKRCIIQLVRAAYGIAALSAVMQLQEIQRDTRQN